MDVSVCHNFRRFFLFSCEKIANFRRFLSRLAKNGDLSKPGYDRQFQTSQGKAIFLEAKYFCDGVVYNELNMYCSVTIEK
jgi:hypothetical protein